MWAVSGVDQLVPTGKTWHIFIVQGKQITVWCAYSSSVHRYNANAMQRKSNRRTGRHGNMERVGHTICTIWRTIAVIRDHGHETTKLKKMIFTVNFSCVAPYLCPREHARWLYFRHLLIYAETNDCFARKHTTNTANEVMKKFLKIILILYLLCYPLSHHI